MNLLTNLLSHPSTLFHPFTTLLPLLLPPNIICRKNDFSSMKNKIDLNNLIAFSSFLHFSIGLGKFYFMENDFLGFFSMQQLMIATTIISCHCFFLCQFHHKDDHYVKKCMYMCFLEL